jgi:hypothetical protein
MPIQIDQLDSDVEIVPSTTGTGGASAPGAPAAASPASPAAPGGELRRLIVRTLEDELATYLRTRG